MLDKNQESSINVAINKKNLICQIFLDGQIKQRPQNVHGQTFNKQTIILPSHSQVLEFHMEKSLKELEPWGQNLAILARK